MAKKRNPTDATNRNVAATNKKLKELFAKVKELRALIKAAIKRNNEQ